MAILSGPGAIGDGPGANTQLLDFGATLPVVGTQVLGNSTGGQIIPGQVVCRDVTKQQSNIFPINNAPSTLYQAAGDTVCLPNSNNAGDVFGVYQGGLYNNATGSNYNAQSENFRKIGVGKVLAGTLTGGTSVKVGDGLITTTTANFAQSGARAIGTSVGRVIGYPISCNIPTAITFTGSQVVTPALSSGFGGWFGGYPLAGITTSTPLTIDTGVNQEIVTPSAITAGTAATTALTVATPQAGATLTVTLASTGFPTVVISVGVITGDTATTAAARMVQAINALGTYINATNAAGVITVGYVSTGTAGNSVTATPSVANAGTTTFTGTAALAGGVAANFTATFANTHPANTPILGFVGAVGSVIIPTGTGGNLTALILADINICA